MEAFRDHYDLCVIGGGINGAGIARDAAGRGLSVLLVEAEDLASGTSSASTKLIHGGLRYLEFCEFKMVREALMERSVLQNIAPHLVRPLEFILPYAPKMRPYWLLRLGLLIYDHLGKRRTKLPRARAVNFSHDPVGLPLVSGLKRGFSYYDCWVDDARLVVANARDAADRGADIATYTRCEKIEPSSQKAAWRVHLKDKRTGEDHMIEARAVVNAAGPWVRHVLEASGLDGVDVPQMRLVKGSHIIVPRQYEGDHAYILQQEDQRIIFAIPYEDEYTLIGTTEVDYDGDLRAVEIDAQEVEYLCSAFNAAFFKKISAQDVVWSYSGVRPLFADGSESATETTRDFYIHQQFSNSGAPLLSVFGGKLTTYRVVSERVSDIVSGFLDMDSKRWTDRERLGGGNLKARDFNDFIKRERMTYPFLSPDLVERYARCYGGRMVDMLNGAMSYDDLGEHYGGGLYEREVEYLVRHEWARSVDDILLRRTKLGLHVSRDVAEKLAQALPKILKRVLPNA